MERIESRTWMYVAGAAALLVAIWVLRPQKGKQERRAVDAATPVETQKVQEVLLPSIAELLTLIEQPPTADWETIKESPGLDIYRKKTGDSPIAIIKARVLIDNATADDVMQVIWDVHVRVTWDTVMKGFRELEVLGNDSSVIYFYVKPPVPFIAARDFVQLRCRQNVGEATLISYQSVERPDCPIPEGYVRGNTIISGYRILQKTDKQCEVDFISQTDVKGSIPIPLLNAIAPTRAMDWTRKMAKAAQGLRSGEGKRSD